MRYLLLTIAAAGLLWAPQAAYCLDFMTMPTADQLPPGGFYAGYYLIDIPDTPDGASRINLYQTAFGFADKIEVSYLTWRPDQGSSFKAFNLSFQVEQETEDSWSTTIGVYNLFSNDYLRGSKPSYFIAAAKTVQLSQQASGRGPAYRALVGYGTRSHDRWFYGLQTLLDPQLSATVARYASQSIYGLDYALQAKQDSPVLHAGTFDGDPYYGISLTRAY